MRLISVLAVAFAGLWATLPAKAADDPFGNYLFNTCIETEAYWIGKDPKAIEANCACKSKTEEKLADPAFKKAVMDQKPYDKFPFGDPASYQSQILTACPKLRPLMVDAICNDPNAPKSACDDIKATVKGLK